MDLVLIFLGCAALGFSMTYWSNIKNSIQQQMITSKSLKGFTGKSVRERYYEAYEYLSSEFGVRTNVLTETEDKDRRIKYVQKYGTNQPKCLIPSSIYGDEDFMQHFITIANLYKEFDSDDLIKKYLPEQTRNVERKVKGKLESLGIQYFRGGY